jgi:predicted Fe-Mo cluster-binding NifX family protein
MKVAIPVWNDGVSPVFDVARRLRIFDLADRTPAAVTTVAVRRGGAADAVVELGVDLLICSGIAAGTRSMLRLAGVDVLADICGPPESIVAAYAAGNAALSQFHAPGPCTPAGGRAAAVGRGRRRKEVQR